ncbi:cell division protein FtsZ, partial [Sphingomonas sp. HMWF008]
AEPAAVVPTFQAPEPSAPAADDTPSEAPTRRRWLSPGTAPAAEPVAEIPAEPVAPAPRVKLGGTLFERMSSVSRGAARDEDPAPDKDPLDIPRFLHRQNNQ